MTYRTPEQAAEWLCPFARTFAATKATPHCQGPSCALWQWVPLSSAVLTQHVQARMAEIEAETGKKPSHKDAVAWVTDRREQLGIPTQPTHGYCGPRGA